MFKLKTKLFAAAAALLCAGTAFAQDSGPLIDLLVKKGIINDQEGEELRADLARDAAAAVTATISGGKSTANLSIAGRIQVQYAGLATDISGTAADPVSTSHFFLRRAGFVARRERAEPREVTPQLRDGRHALGDGGRARGVGKAEEDATAVVGGLRQAGQQGCAKQESGAGTSCLHGRRS